MFLSSDKSDHNQCSLSTDKMSQATDKMFLSTDKMSQAIDKMFLLTDKSDHKQCSTDKSDHNQCSFQLIKVTIINVPFN